MSRLTFCKEWYTNGDDGIVVSRDEAVKEGTAEARNHRGGAREPGFGDAEDFNIAARGWR